MANANPASMLPSSLFSWGQTFWFFSGCKVIIKKKSIVCVLCCIFCSIHFWKYFPHPTSPQVLRFPGCLMGWILWYWMLLGNSAKKKPSDLRGWNNWNYLWSLNSHIHGHCFLACFTIFLQPHCSSRPWYKILSPCTVKFVKNLFALASISSMLFDQLAALFWDLLLCLLLDKRWCEDDFKIKLLLQLLPSREWYTDFGLHNFFALMDFSNNVDQLGHMQDVVSL